MREANIETRKHLDFGVIDAVLDYAGSQSVVQAGQNQPVRSRGKVDELPFRSIGHPATNMVSTAFLHKLNTGCILCDHETGMLAAGLDDALLGESEQTRPDELTPTIDLSVVHP